MNIIAPLDEMFSFTNYGLSLDKNSLFFIIIFGGLLYMRKSESISTPGYFFSLFLDTDLYSFSSLIYISFCSVSSFKLSIRIFVIPLTNLVEHY